MTQREIGPINDGTAAPLLGPADCPRRLRRALLGRRDDCHGLPMR